MIAKGLKDLIQSALDDASADVQMVAGMKDVTDTSKARFDESTQMRVVEEEFEPTGGKTIIIHLKGGATLRRRDGSEVPLVSVVSFEDARRQL